MMKFKVLFILIFVILSSNVSGQKLTLSDLETICNYKNWESVNQYMLRKGWEYHSSSKGSSTEYNTITWSYNKNYYDDKASAWFFLYTYEGFPNKISYSVFNKPSYTVIYNSLGSKAYKLIDNEIEDDEIINNYSNNNFLLEISTEKRESDYSYNNSVTAYNFQLIKKASVYDPDNGLKKDYWDDAATNIQTVYTLKNGKFHGNFTSYFLNGNKKREGYYINGVENGLFKEYNEKGFLESEYHIKNGEFDGSFKTYYETGVIKKTGSFFKGLQNGNFTEYNEVGNITLSYTMKNDKLDGVAKYYTNSKVVKEVEYKNGILHGIYKEFLYDDDGIQIFRLEGLYVNEKKNGLWQFFYTKNGENRLLSSENYSNDIKNGKFQKVSGDSLIIGSYNNDKLHGDYFIYIDIPRLLFGTVINTDTSELILTEEGYYENGLKSGYWKYYSFAGDLILTAYYSNDKKTGKWSYYYPKYVDEQNNPLSYAGKLYLTENYENDKKNGQQIRLSLIEEIKYPCDTIINNQHLDTCTNRVYKETYQSFMFKNDVLHGACIIKDSANITTFKGNFSNGKKDGFCLESYTSKGIDNKPFYIFEEGNYLNGERNGEWKEYAQKDYIWSIYNYTNGKLNGKYTSYLKNFKPREIKDFKSGKLEKLIVYDSLGINITRIYEIFDETDNSMKVRKTEITVNNKISIEYFVKKDEPELNHNVFELLFYLKTGKYSNGEDGYPDGMFQLSDNNGDILIEGILYKEDREGIWKFYYSDQNVRLEIEYNKSEVLSEKYFDMNTNELFKGDFVYIDNETGNKEIRQIKNGLRNGKTIYYDAQVNKTKTEKYKDGKIK